MAEILSRNNQYTITDRAHITVAKYVKDREIYLGWGKLPSSIAAPTVGTKTPTTGGNLEVGSHRYRVTAFTDFGETSGSAVALVDLVAGQNAVNLGWSSVSGSKGYRVYKLSLTSGVYELLGETSTASYTDLTGLTNPDKLLPTSNSTVIDPWTTSPVAPPESLNLLYNEVGRRRANIKKFVKRDPNGEIVTAVLNSQNELELVNWSESAEPTNNLYFQVGFALSDASDQTIYQFGVFTDTVPALGNENKNYLLPSEISDFGNLIAVANVAPVYRDSTSREIREVIITF